MHLLENSNRFREKEVKLVNWHSWIRLRPEYLFRAQISVGEVPEPPRGGEDPQVSPRFPRSCPTSVWYQQTHGNISKITRRHAQNKNPSTWRNFGVDATDITDPQDTALSAQLPPSVLIQVKHMDTSPKHYAEKQVVVWKNCKQHANTQLDDCDMQAYCWKIANDSKWTYEEKLQHVAHLAEMQLS